MIPAPCSLCVPARFAALASLLRPLQEPAAGSTGNPETRATLLRAQTVVEELFANSIHHGYQGESDNPVWLEIEADQSGLRIAYADSAAPHDPLAARAAAQHTATDDSRLQVGGVGHRLVAGLADRRHYQRRAGRNELRLEFDWKA